MRRSYPARTLGPSTFRRYAWEQNYARRTPHDWSQLSDPSCLLIVGNSGSPSADDQSLASEIASLGFTVAYGDDSDVEVTSGWDIVVISESCIPGTLNDKYLASAMPVLHMEPAAWDGLGGVNAWSTAAVTDDSADTTVYYEYGNGSFTWTGEPLNTTVTVTTGTGTGIKAYSDATFGGGFEPIVIEASGQPTRIVCGCYPINSTVYGGATAKADYVALAFSEAWPSNWNAASRQLFADAVNWLTRVPQNAAADNLLTEPGFSLLLQGAQGSDLLLQDVDSWEYLRSEMFIAYNANNITGASTMDSTQNNEGTSIDARADANTISAGINRLSDHFGTGYDGFEFTNGLEMAHLTTGNWLDADTGGITFVWLGEVNAFNDHILRAVGSSGSGSQLEILSSATDNFGMRVSTTPGSIAYGDETYSPDVPYLIIVHFDETSTANHWIEVNNVDNTPATPSDATVSLPLEDWGIPQPAQSGDSQVMHAFGMYLGEMPQVLRDEWWDYAQLVGARTPNTWDSIRSQMHIAYNANNMTGAVNLDATQNNEGTSTDARADADTISANIARQVDFFGTGYDGFQFQSNEEMASFDAAEWFDIGTAGVTMAWIGQLAFDSDRVIYMLGDGAGEALGIETGAVDSIGMRIQPNGSQAYGSGSYSTGTTYLIIAYFAHDLTSNHWLEVNNDDNTPATPTNDLTDSYNIADWGVPEPAQSGTTQTMHAFGFMSGEMTQALRNEWWAYAQAAGASDVATLDQTAFRWRDDTATESADSGWLAAQNVNINRNKETVTRLRILVDATGDPASGQFKLQYRKKSTGPWKDVPIS